MKKPETVEKWIKRLIFTHSLLKIKLIFNSNGIVARAYPTSYHKIVTERREAAFVEEAKKSENISMKRATEITKETMNQVATAGADTIAEVLTILETRLPPK